MLQQILLKQIVLKIVLKILLKIMLKQIVLKLVLKQIWLKQIMLKQIRTPMTSIFATSCDPLLQTSIAYELELLAMWVSTASNPRPRS